MRSAGWPIASQWRIASSSLGIPSCRSPSKTLTQTRSMSSFRCSVMNSHAYAIAPSLKYCPNEKFPSISKKVRWRPVSPTSSMSCVRKHFCGVVSNGAGGCSRPRKNGISGCMPALVRSVERSSARGISDADGRNRWSFDSKKARNPARSSPDVRMESIVGAGPYDSSSVTSAAETAEQEAPAEPQMRPVGPWRQAIRRFCRQRLGVVALVVLILIFAAGAFASVVAPYGYNEIHIDLKHFGRTQPPTLHGHHFFGTDDAGKDVLSQTLYGVRTSVKVALSVAGLAGLIGIVIGGLAGYYGGWVDTFLGRVVDTMISL